MSPGRVLVNDVSAAWTPGVDVVAGASLTLAPGTLCAVVGPVGSGKVNRVSYIQYLGNNTKEEDKCTRVAPEGPDLT